MNASTNSGRVRLLGLAKVVARWSALAEGRARPRGAEVALFGVLVLVSVAYGIAASVLLWVRSIRAVDVGVPVVSVGNLVVGGTGKTPLVIALARRLRDMGREVAVVSRGYGRSGRGTVVVSRGDRPLLGCEKAGDEPVLTALVTKGVRVVAGVDRVAAARLAVQKLGADVILLDDGLQYVRLRRDVDIVAVDAERPVGNGHLLPAGVLREHPVGIRRADLIVATRCGAHGTRRVEASIGALAPKTPIVATRMRPVEFWDVFTGRVVRLPDVKDAGCVALSGIARPRDFEATLAELGVRILARLAYPDHHRYTEGDRARILDVARAHGARLIVTTEKDAVRLSDWRPPVPLVALGVEIEVLDGERALERVLRSAISCRES